MSTYNTNNPVEPNGSTDPRDLYDNAQNLDIATNSITRETWLDRLNRSRKSWFGMEKLFDALMSYLKGLGEDAISSIGWQELGDWAVSLTIYNRNQVVWYDNAWYKYIGELPHTIVGESPESDGGIWSADNLFGKWVNIGDAALRGDLFKSDGLKLIGRCPDIATLRTIEPARGSQLIDVVEYIAGGKVGGGYFVYDATDTTSADDGGSVIVTTGGARWKRSEYTKKYVYPEWFGAKADGTDCLPAMQAALNLATMTGGDLLLGAGTYVCNGDLIKARVSTCPNIRGVGIGRNDSGIRTTLQFTEGYSFKILGLPGNLLGARLENFVVRGGSQLVDVALIISCSCNITPINLAFENCVTGISLRNDMSGGFTEFCVITDCVFRYNCHWAIVYEVIGGRDSFRGSGPKNCTFENWNPSSGYHVRIGSGALVYNAPMDFNANVGSSMSALILHNGSGRSTVFGKIKVEKNASNSVELVENVGLYIVGELLTFTPTIKTSRAIYCYRVTVNEDSTVNRDRRPYSFSRLVASGDTIEKFMSGESALLEVTFYAINYEYKYLLSVSANRTDSGGSVTIVSTMRSLNNPANYGPPVFSFSNEGVVVTNINWPSSTVTMQAFITFTGTRAQHRMS